MAKKTLPFVREPSPSSSEEEEEEEEEEVVEEEEEEEVDEEEEEEEEEEVAEEEEEVAEEEEQESDGGSDDDDKSKDAPTPTPSVKAKASDQAPRPDDSGSDSESESDSPPPSAVLKSDLNAKPLASKPIPNTKSEPAKGKGVAAPTAPALAAEAKTTAAGAKRPSQDDLGGTGSHSKKAKNGKPSDASKKQSFQRLWSEDDEVALLKGIIEYTAKTRAIPTGDMKSFHDFIKKSVHFEASTSQLSEKVRRLKSKYKKNADKATTKGAEMKFSKDHEQICYDLSKQVWGNVNDSSEASEHQAKANNIVPMAAGAVVARKVDLGSGSLHRTAVTAGGHGGDLIRQGLALIGDSWSPSFEKKWKELQVEDMKLYTRRVSLIQGVAKHLMDSYYA